MTLADLKEHLVQAAAAALLLGGGAAIVDNKVDLARHDERITRIEELDESMKALQDDLKVTREELARVSARQER